MEKKIKIKVGKIEVIAELNPTKVEKSPRGREDKDGKALLKRDALFLSVPGISLKDQGEERV
jgi:hypothetical protein